MQKIMNIYILIISIMTVIIFSIMLSMYFSQRSKIDNLERMLNNRIDEYRKETDEMIYKRSDHFESMIDSHTKLFNQMAAREGEQLEQLDKHQNLIEDAQERIAKLENYISEDD